jgi:hypothetical protein
MTLSSQAELESSTNSHASTNSVPSPTRIHLTQAFHDLSQHFPASPPLKSGHSDNRQPTYRRMAGRPEDIRVDSIRHNRYVTQATYLRVQILTLHFGYSNDLVTRMNERGERFAQVKGPGDIQTKSGMLCQEDK